MVKIIGNGKLFTRNKELPYIENGAVVVEQDKIKDFGKLDAMLEKYEEHEFIDAKKGLIMPAFINTHEHIYSELARGFSINNYAPKGFLDILDGLWWNIDRHLVSDELIRACATATYIECIKNGVTTVFDHHASFGKIENSLFTIADESKRMNLRSCLCYEISDRDGAAKADKSIEENVNFINYAKKEKMLKGMMGMHASFTISDETMEKCAKALPSDTGYHIHVAEGILDLTSCLKEHNKRIIDRLYDFGVLGRKTIAVHCIYINQHEIELLKETDTMTVHNPESNMGNACGCPPTLALVNNGVLTGLGTDGYTHDMIESYKVANVLHKHSLCDPTVAWGEIPQMLFEGNRQIANRYFEDELGIIKAGAAADIIIVDYDSPTPMDDSNINGHILFGMNGAMVNTTMCAGKVLMRDRKLCLVDEADELRNVREQAKILWNSINS